jgi:predicted ArsR family transcriptional regulator
MNVISDDHVMFPVTRAGVYWCIFDKGSCTAQDIAVGTAMSKITAQGHLAALEKAGVLRGEGRPKRYRITENLPLEYIVKLQELESLARSAWRLNGIEPL